MQSMLNRRHIISAILAIGLSFSVTSNAYAKGHKSDSRQKLSKTVAVDSYQSNRGVSSKIRGASAYDRAYPTYQLQSQRAISPAEAKSIARSRVKGGEVVDISRRGDTYRVRIIAKNGKVVDVYIDANTGRVKK